MEFATIEKTSLIDFPGRVCSVLFTIGCNFKCPFCHNKMLVLPELFPKNTLPEDRVLKILENRKKYVDAVSITGGEPTLHNDLIDFLKKLKEKGFTVKLDTNGTNPEMIETIINEKLVDYFAMDIKSTKDRYSFAIGKDIEDETLDKIEQSVQKIVDSGIDYDMRTTIVPGIHTVDDIEAIAIWLKDLGVKKYVIQTFRPTKDSLIDSDYETKSEFKDKEVNMFVESAQKIIDNTEVRNYA